VISEHGLVKVELFGGHHMQFLESCFDAWFVHVDAKSTSIVGSCRLVGLN
jgi:hypothetical protein